MAIFFLGRRRDCGSADWDVARGLFGRPRTRLFAGSRGRDSLGNLCHGRWDSVRGDRGGDRPRVAAGLKLRFLRRGQNRALILTQPRPVMVSVSDATAAWQAVSDDGSPAKAGRLCRSYRFAADTAAATTRSLMHRKRVMMDHWMLRVKSVKPRIGIRVNHRRHGECTALSPPQSTPAATGKIEGHRPPLQIYS